MNNKKCLEIIFSKVNDKSEIANLISQYYINNQEYHKVIDFLKEFPNSEKRICRELMVTFYVLGDKDRSMILAKKILNEEYYAQGFKEEKLLTKLLAEKILYPDKDDIKEKIEKITKNLHGLREKYLNYLRIIEGNIK